MSDAEEREEVFDPLQELENENRSLRSALDEYRSMVDKYRTLAERSLAGIYVIQDDRFQYVNPRLTYILGYEREDDLIGTDFRDVIHEEDRPKALNPESRGGRGLTYPDRNTFRALRKDGSVAWLDLSNVAARYMDRPATVGTVIDITDQRETQEALLQSEEKYRTIIEQIEDGYYEVDLRGNVTFFNDSFARILGHPQENLLGANYREFASSLEAKNIARVFGEVFSTGEPVRALAWEIHRDDGVKRHIELSVSLMRDRRGHCIGFRGVARDVTERKRAEEALRRHRNELEDLVRERSIELIEANEQLTQEVVERRRAEEDLIREKSFSDSLISSLPGIFYVLDEAGRFFRWNENMEAMSGLSGEQLWHSQALDLFIPEDKALVRERIAETFHTGRGSVEATVKAKDGLLIQFFLTGVRIELDGDAFLLGVGVDITERKKAEEALIASEKELRILSSKLITAQETERQGLAMELHDGVGQALTAMKVRLESILKTLPGERIPEERESLWDLIPMIQEMVEDVRRMSMALRPSMLDKLGILSTLNWFFRQFDHVYPSITVEKKIDLEESNIPERLKIVIYRIVQEASNNVSKHGGSDHLSVRLGRKDGGIELVIRDNGQGFDLDAVLGLASDQRGFGLAGMRERAELSGGVFDLRTGPGIGTTIKAFWSAESLRVNG